MFCEKNVLFTKKYFGTSSQSSDVMRRPSEKGSTCMKEAFILDRTYSYSHPEIL